MTRRALVSILFAFLGAGVFADSTPPSANMAPSAPSASLSGARFNGTDSASVSPSDSFHPMADANFSGAFTWNYPIDIPAGTHGVQPKLSISYNSQAPNGMLGMGFQLTGLSVIERDASRGAILFSSTDTYDLDGQKLYYSTGDSQFHPERETYDRIQAFTASGGATPTANPNAYDSYWVVSKKDGTKLYYGATVDSRVGAVGKFDAQNNQLTRVWALSKVIDSLGNYYSIVYQQDSSTGAYDPSQIVYAKNDAAAMTLYKVVQFLYETRADHYSVFQPTKVDLDRRLKWITVLTGTDIAGNGGTLVSKYRLDYQQSGATGTSLLTAIQQFGSDQSTLPVTTITWSNTAPGFSSGPDLLGDFSPNQGYTDANTFPIITGDWNGDGKTDIARVRSDGIAFYCSTGTGWVAMTGITGDLGTNQGYTDANTFPIITGDWNGDGKTDIARVRSDGIVFYCSTGTGWVAMTGITGDLGTNQGYTDANAFPIVTGDWNGDGKIDIARIRSDGLRVYLSTGSGWAQGTGITNDLGINQGYTGGSVFPIITGDWNGDGKTDIARIRSDGLRVYLSTGSGWVQGTGIANDLGSNQSYTDGNVFPIVTGDWNGDGKTDIARIRSDGLRVYLSTGSDWVQGTGIANDLGINQSYTDGNVFPIVTGDWNGDGKTDIARIRSDGLRVYLSTGSDWVQGTGIANDLGTTPAQGYSNGNKFPIITGDWNGDGKSDVARVRTDRVRVYSLDAAPKDVLVKIASPQGGTVQVTYTPTDLVPGATIPSNSSYPNIANPSTRSLVTNIKFNDGLVNTPTISTSYQYYNGLYLSGFSRDRTDLGFQRVTKINDADGAQTVTTFSQTFPTQGMPTDVIVKDGQGNPWAETITTYNRKSIDNSAIPTTTVNGVPMSKVEFVFPTSVTQKRFDRQTTSTDTQTTYDSYDSMGNLTQTTDKGVTDTQGNYDPKAAVVHLVQYGWASTGYLCRPTDEQILSYDSTGVQGVASETRYYYDGSTTLGSMTNGLQTGVESVISTSPAQSAISTVAYDAWGNPTSRTDASGVVLSQATYDANYHSLVTSTTDARGLTTTVTGWDVTLQPTTVVDPQGNVSQKQYDVFGRVHYAVSPQAMASSSTTPRDSLSSPTATVTYSDVPTVSGSPAVITGPVSQTTVQKTTGTNTLSSVTYVDGLGRTVQTKTLAKVGGQYVTVDKYYDASGRNYEVSNPYLTPSSAFSWSLNNASTQVATNQATQFQFDVLGRVTIVTHPDGSFRRTLYNQAVTTQIDEMNHLTQTEDRGNVKYSRLYAGTYTGTLSPTYAPPSASLYATTTALTYRGEQRIVDTNGNTIRTLFDMAGRKTQYIDPDMGTWNYQYNPNGSLVQQTDGKGNVIAFDYDSAGRVIDKKHGGTVVAAYTYGTTGYQNGQLESVSLNGSPYLSYTYDKLGRTSTTTKTIGAYGSKTMTMTYNNDGLLATKQFPGSAETLSYSYSPEGQLYALGGTGTYLSGVTVDDLGRITSQTLGNGTMTSYTFDPVTLQTTDIVTPGVQSLHYTFDSVGNVLTKIDNVNSSASESYVYDEMNRLQTAWGIYGNRTYLYDALNNLLGMNGTAVNVYAGTGPHQITNDGTYTYSYDSNGNMVSRINGTTADRTYVYDTENRMTSATVGGVETDYTYDDSRQRTTMTVNGKTTVFWFDGYEETYTAGVLTETVRSYSVDGQKVAQTSSVSGLVFVYSDHLGSTNKVRDAGGNVTASYYEPYGKLVSTTINGVREAFTGQDWDGAADLYYYNARYYSATLGRFMQGDPALTDRLSFSSLTISERINPYLYCLDSPIVFSDPTGLWTFGLGVVFGYNGGKWSVGFGVAADWGDNTKAKTQGLNISTVFGGNGWQTITGAGFASSNGDYNGFYSNTTIDSSGFHFEQSLDVWEFHESAFVYFTEYERSFGINTDFGGISIVGLSAGWQWDAGLFVDTYVPGMGLYADTSGNVQADFFGATYNAGKFGPESGWLADYTYGNRAGAKRDSGDPIDQVDAIAYRHDKSGMSWNSNVRAAHEARNLLQYHNRELTPYQRVAARNLLLLGPAAPYAAYVDWKNHH